MVSANAVIRPDARVTRTVTLPHRLVSVVPVKVPDAPDGTSSVADVPPDDPPGPPAEPEPEPPRRGANWPDAARSVLDAPALLGADVPPDCEVPLPELDVPLLDEDALPCT